MEPAHLALLVGGISALTLATCLGALLVRVGFPVPQPHRRIGQIDGLRGYLALLVLIQHFYIWLRIAREHAAWSAPPGNFAAELGAGSVGLFFMVTGLVFYPVILRGLQSTWWPGLYITRAFRILPMVLLSVIIVTIVIVLRTERMPSSDDLSRVAYWISSAGEPDLIGYADSGVVNAHVLWTLWYEWLFYIAILPATAAISSAVQRAALPSVCTPVVLLSIFLAMRLTEKLTSWRSNDVQFLPLFALGMLAFECQRSERWRAALSSNLATGGAVAALIVTCTVQAHPYAIGLPFLAFFFICVACGNDLGGILRFRAAVVLGECSFGIYILHGILLNVVFVEGRGWVNGLSWAGVSVLLIACAGAAVSIATITYIGIERPMLTIGKSLAKRVKGRPVTLTKPEMAIAP